MMIVWKRFIDHGTVSFGDERDVRIAELEATVERLTWMFDELAKACSADPDASDGIWVVYQRRWAEQGGE